MPARPRAGTVTCGACGGAYAAYGPLPGDAPGTLRAFWHGGHEAGATCAGSWEPHPATEVRQPRERNTGRYADTKFSRLCVCGHRLGIHTAERLAGPRVPGQRGRPPGIQPCLEADCACECFTRATRPGR